jgi:hypothetical protein
VTEVPGRWGDADHKPDVSLGSRRTETNWKCELKAALPIAESPLNIYFAWGNVNQLEITFTKAEQGRRGRRDESQAYGNGIRAVWKWWS